MTIRQRIKCGVETLEPRALLSHANPAVAANIHDNKGPSMALVGSIEGTETWSQRGAQLAGTGTVTPLGNVTVTGFFGGGNGALNDKGTLTFSNAQGSLTFSVKTHGYFPLRSQRAEEIRVTVQPRSATGSVAGIADQGTINLVNPVAPHHFNVDPFTAQINLKPGK